MKKLILLAAMILIANTYSCPQFKLNDVRCTVEDGTFFYLNTISLEGNEYFYIIEMNGGREGMKTFPSSEIMNGVSFETECVDDKVVINETFGAYNVSSILSFNNGVVKLVGEAIKTTCLSVEDCDNANFTFDSIAKLNTSCQEVSQE